MANALKLETEIEKFFQTWCSGWAPKAKKIFDDRVKKVARRLLTEKVAYSGIDMKGLADSDLFKSEPKFALEASLLFDRAVKARLPTQSENKISRKKILTEHKHSKAAMYAALIRFK